MGSRRVCLAGVAVAAAVAAAPACGSVARFELDGLVVSHPASWRVQQFADVSGWTPGGTRVIAYLSPLVLRNPCRPIARGGTACTFPLRRLPRRGVLVTWLQDSNRPGLSLAGLAGGVPTSIGGNPARVKVSPTGECRAIGGEETVRALIDAGALPGGGFYEMTACLRGPGLARATRTVRTMLASARITGA